MERKTPVISPAQMEAQQQVLGQIALFWKSRAVTPTAFVDTYGCQQNEADSEHIRGMLTAAGYERAQSEEGADVVVINTCAVREHAQDRVFGNIGALVHTKRRHPRQKIFVCGCMMGQPHVAEKIRKSYRHIDGVFSTHHMWEFPSLLWQILTAGGRVFSTEDSEGAIAEGLPVERGSGLKAWVSIMYGCNNFCSYCIVPYVRGRERSREPGEIIREVTALAQDGYKEITLLGQNVNSYGKDLGISMDFSDLLEQLSQIPGEFLLRFMTSHPKDASKKLFDTMARHENIAKQLHLPFQAGNDRVLTQMNRGYTAAQYLDLVAYARSVMKNLVLTSDVIVGFPTETDEEFDDTLGLIEKVGYDALFTFIYSPREGTPAASLPDPATKEEKGRRFDRLVALQNRISEEKHAAYEGKTLRVLVDGQEDNLLTARTQGGRLVRFAGDSSQMGCFVDVMITGHGTWSLTGECCPNID